MAHRVFISYSSKDKSTADAICARLEATGISCWIAPRDIEPGALWADAIDDALSLCTVMVLVFSSWSNASKDVKKEVQGAMDRDLALIPFRIEDIKPGPGLSYHLSSMHWLNAFPPPLSLYLDALADRLMHIMGRRGSSRPVDHLELTNEQGPMHEPSPTLPSSASDTRDTPAERVPMSVDGTLRSIDDLSGAVGIKSTAPGWADHIGGQTERPPIRIIGVGGCGGNFVSKSIEKGQGRDELIVMNTDRQVLDLSGAQTRLQLGPVLTRGLGAGGDPSIGERAAIESEGAIADILRGARLVCIVAGMGGGTGTGASPVIARVARDVGATVIATVTQPFMFEGPRRRSAAEKGTEALRAMVDGLVVFPNDRLLDIAPKKAPLAETFRIADDAIIGVIRAVNVRFPSEAADPSHQHLLDEVPNAMARAGFSCSSVESEAGKFLVAGVPEPTAGTVTFTSSTDLQNVDWNRVGRNDPCPCGSGKKFNECHYCTLAR